MKKIVSLAVFSLVFGVAMVWCATKSTEPVESTEPTVLGTASTFEEAVQECYRLTAETLFYSTNGKKQTAAANRVSGPNEIPGVCTDYALEFAYHWNEVKRYDELFGKAYLIKVNPGASTFDISDFRFVENGTVKIRKPGSFMVNANDREVDGVYRDAIITSVVLKGKLFPHFGTKSKNHMWVVINYNDEWYDCEPTWWDISNEDLIPYKLSIGKASVSGSEKWEQIVFNPTPTKFEGVWRNPHEKYNDSVYEFTGNKWKYTCKKKSEWGSGFFTFTNDEITLYRENGKKWWYGSYSNPTYKITDAYLRIYLNDKRAFVLLKQPAEEFVTSGEMFDKIQGSWIDITYNTTKSKPNYIFSGNHFSFSHSVTHYDGTFAVTNNGLLKLITTKGTILLSYSFSTNESIRLEYISSPFPIWIGIFNKQ